MVSQYTPTPLLLVTWTLQRTCWSSSRFCRMEITRNEWDRFPITSSPSADCTSSCVHSPWSMIWSSAGDRLWFSFAAFVERAMFILWLACVKLSFQWACELPWLLVCFQWRESENFTSTSIHISRLSSMCCKLTRLWSCDHNRRSPPPSLCLPSDLPFFPCCNFP